MQSDKKVQLSTSFQSHKVEKVEKVEKIVGKVEVQSDKKVLSMSSRRHKGRSHRILFEHKTWQKCSNAFNEVIFRESAFHFEGCDYDEPSSDLVQA